MQINAENVKLQQRFCEITTGSEGKECPSEQKNPPQNSPEGRKDISRLHIAKLDLCLRPMVHGWSQGT